MTTAPKITCVIELKDSRHTYSGDNIGLKIGVHDCFVEVSVVNMKKEVLAEHFVEKSYFKQAYTYMEEARQSPNVNKRPRRTSDGPVAESPIQGGNTTISDFGDGVLE